MTARAANLVTLSEAAALEGVTVRALRLAIARGAPVAKRGGRGRGRATLVDLDAMRAWRGAGGLSARQATLLRRGLAVEALDVVLADALHAEFTSNALAHFGLKPRQAGPLLAYAWYVTQRAIRAHLEREGCELAAPTTPEKIDAIRNF